MLFQEQTSLRDWMILLSQIKAFLSKNVYPIFLTYIGLSKATSKATFFLHTWLQFPDIFLLGIICDNI